MADICQEIFFIEVLKYKRIGLWVLFPLVFWPLFFKYLPTFLYHYWIYLFDPQDPISTVFIFLSLKYSSYFGLNLLYAIINYSKIHYFEGYKIQKNARDFEVGDEYSLYKTIKMTLFNETVFMPIIVLVVHSKMNFDYSDRLPDTLEILKMILFCNLGFEIIFFIIHNVMHSPYFYSRFHKLHHEYARPESFVLTYNHPVSFLLEEILPFFLSVVFYGSYKIHFVTFLVYTIFKYTSHAVVHSCYNFPWNPFNIFPLISYGDFHDYHHTRLDRNFGARTYLLDLIMGSLANFRERRINERNRNNLLLE